MCQRIPCKLKSFTKIVMTAWAAPTAVTVD